MAADDKKKSTVEDSKKKALELALQQIEKNYGKGAVMRLGQNSAMNVECIPTGSLMLDAALGIGGLPRGRIIEIYGPEASGKTTLAIHAIAEAQKAGGIAALLTWNMPSIPCTPRRWGWTWIPFWFLSRIPASRRWKSPKR